MIRLTIRQVIFGGSFAAAMVSVAANAADWGTLKGRFVLNGPSPAVPKLQINKDVEFCGKHEPRSEKLLVHREDRGIANVVIWLDVKSGEKIAVHPAFEESSTAQIKLINKGCRFEPHICVIRTGQTLRIENPDAVAHNTAAGLDRNDPFNEVTAPGGFAERTRFKLVERHPAQVQCSIHPWMTGWLVVKDHPYVAVTDEHGCFEISNMPVGEHTFVVWHEVPEYVQEVTRNGQVESWKRGKVTIRVTAEPTDLGDVQIATDLFKSP